MKVGGDGPSTGGPGPDSPVRVWPRGEAQGTSTHPVQPRPRPGKMAFLCPARIRRAKKKRGRFRGNYSCFESVQLNIMCPGVGMCVCGLC